MKATKETNNEDMRETESIAPCFCAQFQCQSNSFPHRRDNSLEKENLRNAQVEGTCNRQALIGISARWSFVQHYRGVKNCPLYE